MGSHCVALSGVLGYGAQLAGWRAGGLLAGLGLTCESRIGPNTAKSR